MIQHPIPALYDEHAEILILGSFPSIKSREANFFYGHPQNRFWRVLSGVFEQPVPETIAEKQAFILRNHIALWDVIASCEITGSSDSSIKNVVPNDLSPILNAASIRVIFTNGKTAHNLYCRYLEPATRMKAICLPSTSPANASWSLERLISAWRAIENR